MSFFLPAIHFGGPQGKTYIGLVAALLPTALLPLSLKLLPVLADSPPSTGGWAEAGLRVFVGGYFWVLLAQNAWMFLCLRSALRGAAARTPAVHARLALAATVLAAGIAGIDYDRVLGPLGWPGPQVIVFKIGYYCWTASFALLAAGLRFARPPAG